MPNVIMHEAMLSGISIMVNLSDIGPKVRRTLGDVTLASSLDNSFTKAEQNADNEASMKAYSFFHDNSGEVDF